MLQEVKLKNLTNLIFKLFSKSFFKDESFKHNFVFLLKLFHENNNFYLKHISAYVKNIQNDIDDYLHINLLKENTIKSNLLSFKFYIVDLLWV